MGRRALLACLLLSVLGGLAVAGCVLAALPLWSRGKRADVLVADAQRLAGQGRRAEAQQAVARALALCPENTRVHRELAMQLTAENRVQEGLAELEFVAVNASTDPGAAWEFALALRKAGDHARAATWFHQVTVLERRNALARALEAEALLRLHETARALDVAGQAAILAPRSPQVLHVLGVARWRSGDLAGARATLEAAWRLYPASPGPLLSLASMAEEAHQLAAAAGYLQRAAAAKPTDASIQEELGGILLQLGRREEAANAQARAQELRAEAAGLHRADAARASE